MNARLFLPIPFVGLLALAALTGCFAESWAAAGAGEDQQRLQGVWKISKAEHQGKPDPCMKLQLTFAKDKVEYENWMALYDGTLTLDPNAAPKQLDIKTEAWTMRAIYRFEGEKLILAGGSPSWDDVRPKDFAAAKRDKFVWTLERVPAQKVPADASTAREIEMKRTRLRCGGQLERIVRAMHHYYENHEKLPPWAIADQVGKLLLSWRVALLPYLGHKDLYEQFRLDEPWDSEHNRKLLPKMPAAYASPGLPSKTAHGTFYQVFVGEGCLFEEGKQFSLKHDVPNGTSNTIAVATAETAVPWTKPADLNYAAERPLPSLVAGMIEDGLVSFALADSSVFATANVFDADRERALRAAITRNGDDIADFELLKK